MKDEIRNLKEEIRQLREKEEEGGWSCDSLRIIWKCWNKVRGSIGELG